MESDEEESSLEDEEMDARDSEEEEEESEEEEIERPEPVKRTALPKRKQTEEDVQADDLSAALRQKRDEDRSKGKAVSRQLVRPHAFYSVHYHLTHNIRRYGTHYSMHEFDCRSPCRPRTVCHPYVLLLNWARDISLTGSRRRTCQRSYPILHASQLNTRL